MKNKAAQEMARKRAESMTPERRKEVARKAGKARWAKRGVNPDVGTEEVGPMLTRTVSVEEVRRMYPDPKAIEPRLPEAVTKPTQCTKHKLPQPCRRCQ